MNRETVQTVLVSLAFGGVCYAIAHRFAPGPKTAICVGIASAIFAINYYVHLNYHRIARTLAPLDDDSIGERIAELNEKDQDRVWKLINKLRARAN